jgi:ATP synthase protein I
VAEGPEPPEERQPEARFRRDVARKAERRREAQRQGNRSIWFSLGLMGLVGWSVAVPTLLGIALGAWIDSRWPSAVSWTLTLMFVGIVVGCVNAWYWVKHEMKNDQ